MFAGFLGFLYLRHGIPLSLALLILALLSSCLTNPSGPPAQEPTTITLSTYRIVFTAVNDHVRIDATVLDQDSRVIADATLHWRSADISVARVSDRGVVTAAGAGTTQITVSSGYATATATVSVEQAADSIEITPSSIRLVRVGETGQFTAVVYDANDRIIPGAAVGWSSSNPEIATVDANGQVTAVSPGSALITASSGGVSTSRPVHVEVAPEPARIVLNISEATLSAVGQSLQLDAQVYDDNNAAIPGAAITWSSNRPDVATVDAGGLVIAVSNGTTRVTASSGDASAQALIHVVIEGAEPPPPPPEPPPPPDPSPDPSSDRDALVAFYHATGGPNWTDNTNWLSDKPLGEWFGVTTDNDVKVIELYLQHNNLTGTIPAEIGQLQHLRLLRLSDNQLSGPIPPEIGQLRSLERLIILRNQLSGEIPPETGQLGNLTVLMLSTNRLSGSIPSELGNLNSLRTIWISGNRLSGGIPREIGNLNSLTDLTISDNRLSGDIPHEIWNLKSLEYLFFSNNQFTGEIPSAIGDLKFLIRAWFNKNAISGDIPPEIGNLNALESLSLGDNQISGGIPPEIGRLTNLEELFLHSNINLGGPLPLQMTSISTLRDLTLHGTGLCVPSDDTFKAWLAGIDDSSGITFCMDEPESSPPEPTSDRDALEAFYHATGGPNWTNKSNWLSDAPIGTWHGVTADNDQRVTHLALGDNNLTGAIPPEIGQLEALRGLSLLYNNLTGPIPSEIGQLRNLEQLTLPHNEFTGEIPAEIGNLGALWYLNVGDNQLTGQFPSAVLQIDSLQSLYLYENQLTGEIPSEIGDMSALEVLHVAHNRLSGSIPSEIGDLAALKHLLLDNNDLSGRIPPEIGKLGNLSDLNLTNTGLSGNIPSEIGDLTELRFLDLGYNRLTGDIPPELWNLTKLRLIWMHENQLTGEIPPGIGNLTALESLSLYDNQMTGGIPPEIGKMTKLEWWQMGNNVNMSGPLPTEVTTMPSLEYLFLDGTGICAPDNAAFNEWLDNLEDYRVDRCGP